MQGMVSGSSDDKKKKPAVLQWIGGLLRERVGKKSYAGSAGSAGVWRFETRATFSAGY
jgi:hypothetical protein